MEFLSFMYVMISLAKFLMTSKMLIMIMSLEMSSVFLFFLLTFFSFFGGGFVVGLYSIFLVFIISEGVMVLVMMINIYRKGSTMVSSMSVLKF